MNKEELWKGYLEGGNRDEGCQAWAFCGGGKEADELLVLFYGNGSAVHGKCGHSRSLLRALCTIFHGNNTIPPTQKQDGNARAASAGVIVVGE